MLVLVIPPILVVGVYGLVRVHIERAELVAEDQRSAVAIATAAQIVVERAIQGPAPSGLTTVLTEFLHDNKQITRLRVFDGRLQQTAALPAEASHADIPTDVLRRVMAGAPPEGFIRGEGTASMFCYVLPVRAPIGAIIGTMEVGRSTATIDHRVQVATWDIVARLSVLLISMTALTGIVVQRQLLRPLFALTQGIRNLGRGGPDMPLPVERRDELGRVAEAFNTMASQLRHARHELVLETERALDLEQQLRHSATLAVAGRLASGLAHEIGTPLNIVSGRAEFLLHSLPEGDHRRSELQVIIGQIDRISAMIRSLLDTVRPLKPTIQAIHVKAVVDGLLGLLTHTARRHGATLEISIPDDLPPVRADRNQLQQVFINILMNAFEAVRPAGHVLLTAAAATRDSRAGVRIAVSDTGPGIPPALVGKIFEPFVSTKPPGEGTGLGLPICRDIVKSLDGSIDVASSNGRGTAFTIWLPTGPAK
jgi:signal transduction histidine kinase